MTTTDKLLTAHEKSYIEGKGPKQVGGYDIAEVTALYQSKWRQVVEVLANKNRRHEFLIDFESWHRGKDDRQVRLKWISPVTS